VYVATTDDAWRLKVVDCVTDSIIDEVGTGTVEGMCYSPAEGKLYCLNSQGGLEVVNCSLNRVTGYINVAYGAKVAPVYNPRGNKVYFAAAHRGGGTSQLPLSWWVVAVDCVTDEVVARIDVGYEIQTLTVDPDSGYVFAACENSVLYVIKDQSPGGLSSGPSALPSHASLEVKPNPSLGGFLVTASLPTRTWVQVGVYDTTGRLVSMLVDEEAGPGRLQIPWDRTGEEGILPAGTYFVKLQTETQTQTSKIVLTR